MERRVIISRASREMITPRFDPGTDARPGNSSRSESGSRVVHGATGTALAWCLAVLLVASMLSARAQGVPEWRWSHPLPHGNNVADLAFRGGLYAHVTDHGGIYTSTNRLVWDRRASGTLTDLRGVAWFGSRLLVTGEAGTVLWSDDGVRFQAGAITAKTTDWLEGVAASATRAVAVGDNAAIYTSSDGKSWTRVSGLSFTTFLSGVAYGAGQFVAVGDAGFIASSSNGTSWTRRTSPSAVDLFRVAFGDNRFLVTGRNGVVLTSSNGTSWSADTATGVTNSLLAAALAPGERLAVGESACLLRIPPLAWQNHTSSIVSPSPVPAWTYAAALWDGNRYLVGGRTGVFVESFRTNLGGLAAQTFWFRNDDSPRNGLWDVARFEDTYLAVGDVATILSSARGVGWNEEGAPVPSDVILYGIGGSPSVALSVGSSGTILRSVATLTNHVTTNLVVYAGSTNVVLTTHSVSLLGVVWDLLPAVTTNTLQGIAWNGARYVVVGGGGTVLTSTNSMDWSKSTIAGAGFLSSVVPFGGGFVATGTGGAIYQSANGASWTKRSSGTTNWIYRVRDVGGSLIAVGQNGALLVSSDGVVWNARSSGSTAWLTDASLVGRQVFVSGTQGTCVRSTNLVDWSALSLPTGKALYGLASDGVQLVAVGAEGVVLRAIADPDGAPVGMAGYAHVEGGQGGSGGVAVDAMVFSGTPEQRFRWQGATDLGTWSSEIDLELDANGAATLGTPAPPTRGFHRTATRP